MDNDVCLKTEFNMKNKDIKKNNKTGMYAVSKISKNI